MATQALECLGRIPRGRPSTYDKAVADEIVALLWEGRSLRSICMGEDMPSLRTVYGWMDREPDFLHNYEEARRRQAYTLADELQDIADDLAILPEHKRLMIDARKWRAARQNWRAWGDKVAHEHAVSPHAPNDAGQLPPGLGWLARQLPGGDPGARSEPDAGGVGEE